MMVITFFSNVFGRIKLKVERIYYQRLRYSVVSHTAQQVSSYYYCFYPPPPPSSLHPSSSSPSCVNWILASPTVLCSVADSFSLPLHRFLFGSRQTFYRLLDFLIHPVRLVITGFLLSKYCTPSSYNMSSQSKTQFFAG